MLKAQSQTYPQNHHSTVVELSGHGVLIEGPPGSGKTSLAFGLIEKFTQKELPAILISDDQALLEPSKIGDRNILIAARPDPIAGKIEVYGFGIIEQASKAKTHIELVVRLVPQNMIERMPDEKYVPYHGIQLPLIEVPEQHEANAIRIVTAKMDALFG